MNVYESVWSYMMAYGCIRRCMGVYEPNGCIWKYMMVYECKWY